MGMKPDRLAVGQRVGGLILTLSVVLISFVTIRRLRTEIPGTLQSMSTSTSTTAATATATVDAQLRVDSTFISNEQFDYETELRLSEDPSLTRSDACEQAVEYFIAAVLKNEDRARTTSTVSEATVTAAIVTALTFEAQDPEALATRHAEFGTPDLEPDAAIMGTALSLVQHENMMRADQATPSPDEILLGVRNTVSGTMRLAAIEFDTEPEGAALFDDLVTELDEADDVTGFANDFVDQVKAQINSTEREDAVKAFMLQPDISSYPDYVQDAITYGHRSGALAKFQRTDGSGAVYFVVYRSARQTDKLEASVRADLEARNAQRAEATYVSNLRQSAQVEVYVNCSTY